jgi:hypothetical protein
MRSASYGDGSLNTCFTVAAHVCSAAVARTLLSVKRARRYAATESSTTVTAHTQRHAAVRVIDSGTARNSTWHAPGLGVILAMTGAMRSWHANTSPTP